MTSKEPTATDEIRGRIETLTKQIEQALERAREAGDDVRLHNDTASRLALLRTQYLKVLEVTASTGSILVEVCGTMDNPTFVNQVARRVSERGAAL